MARRAAAPWNGSITPDLLASFRTSFESNPANRLALNACTHGNIEEIALNRGVFRGIDWNFSHEVTGGAITCQKKAGTCWMYAGLNWLRTFVIERLAVENFEFSQNYLVFYDRLEKANRFLEAMVALRDRSPDDRKVDWLLRDPSPDGGEWHMIANLIRKYGLAPKSAMADTFNLSDSSFLNKVLHYKLREAAARIFDLHRSGRSLEQVREAKQAMLADIHRMLCILFGEPPQRFDFAYRDKKKRFHSERDLTPHQFYDRYVGVDLDDYVWVMSSPLEDTPQHRTFVIEQYQNVVEGDPGVFVNVSIQELKDIAVRMLRDKRAILFGCDVTQMMSRKYGLMDPSMYEYDLLFGTPFSMDRRERMRFLQARLTHNMVLIGVDLVKGRPTKWKIENSWGEDFGNKGFFHMADRWFDEYMYALVVPRRYLSPRQRTALKEEPTLLPPWHPLG